MEVVKDTCEAMYMDEGGRPAPNCTVVYNKMVSFGYTTSENCTTIGFHGAKGCEAEGMKFTLEPGLRA